LEHVHVENRFREFNREALMPHMLSTEGPALAVSDINNDGLDDFFIGSSRSYRSAVYIQQTNGQFKKIQPEDFVKDSMYEDVDAVWADVNNDGHIDLIVASGGNEYYGKDPHLLPRLYLNNGKGEFEKKADAFNGIYVTTSTVRAGDFNNDGNIDLFIGGRAVPWEYGETPRSFLLQNDGSGKFTDVTEKYAKDLATIGMVTSAAWTDLDNDRDEDLVVSCEWGGIEAFINDSGQFSRKTLVTQKGW